jgi:Fe-S-cluster containining protein
MAKFECKWCGKCCQSFGEFIRIERQLSDRDYYCRYGITNELFLVHVQPEFADEISDEFINKDEASSEPAHKGCEFMRKNPAGKGFACAIYPTRPPICREFKCYRMLIHHTLSGELRGKVIGINQLRTQDKILAAIWKEKVAHLPHPIESQHNRVPHSHSPRATIEHGHDAHVHAHLHGRQHSEDKAWLNNVITVLAAHGYHGDPVED